MPAVDSSSFYAHHIGHYVEYFLGKSEDHSLISILKDRELGTDITIEF